MVQTECAQCVEESSNVWREIDLNVMCVLSTILRVLKK